MLSREEVKTFFSQYKNFFEKDGRHHVWIGTFDNSGLLIYDQHNVIYAYGKLESQLEKLRSCGYENKEFEFPVPHIHLYDPNNDEIGIELLNHWHWVVFPLTPDDTYE